MSTGEHESPFLAAKREWNERYGDYLAQARNWRIAAILSLSICTILALGVVWLAAQTKLVPYVVAIDKLGSAVAIGRADVGNTANAAVVKAQIAQWIVNARMVTTDAGAERAILTRVYSFVDSHAKPTLDDWYSKHSPFETAANHTVSVQVDAVLAQSDQSYQVQWTEQQRDVDGSHAVDTHWEALIMVGVRPPTDEETILKNPMGIYITQISWTKRV